MHSKSMKPESLVAFRIKSLNNKITRYFERHSLKENEDNITGMQFAVLGFINEKERISKVYQKDIEEEFNIRRSTASEMAYHLEEKDLIRRVRSKEDARAKEIQLTQKGRELEEIARMNAINLQNALTRNLTDNEVSLFFELIGKIEISLEND